jgi:hypothetical protein
MFSEIVTDLANELSGCIDWDHRTTRSPAQATTPKPIRLPNGIPLEKGRTMSVLVPETKGGKVDGFIDDLINVFLDSEENCARQPHVVPLAMHITSRPHAGEGKEPIPRRPILSQPKLVAEGSPAEVQVVLGWKVDNRRLEVSLPRDKFDAWMLDLRVSRESKRVDRKELERLLGRLNHAAYVMPIARHFLGRIRTAVGPAPNQRTKGGRTTKLSEAVKAETDKLYAALIAAGVDVVLDDRGERPGAMFADWELIGVPHRVVVGDRGLKEGMLEYQGRRDEAATPVALESMVGFIQARLVA